MQLPNIDRTAIRPAGTEVVVPAAARVIPVAPVNPPAPMAETASVVNDINPAVQARASEAARSDPLQGGSQADNAGKDWTQRKESSASEPEEVPPKEPLSKMLIDHMAAVWSASARVVEIWMQNNPAQNPSVNQQVQAQAQAASRQADPMATPGVIAKEALTYSPTQIKKPEKAE
jgi:hypothetical protein